MKQLNIFELTKPKYKIKKPIRLIEHFAGIGSQAKALKNIGANFEHYRAIDFDEYAIKSYNAIHGTSFEPLDITKITAKDLNIVDTDKYEYIMTYSFPCQDLSRVGKKQGMTKGSGTRSGLLWEVERLLSECETLPQILLMENVTQVHGRKHLTDFNKWLNFLEELGYKNYWSDLNAKNYEIPQTRNRCFMVSILGNYYYEFPHKRKLKLRLKDMLEDEVDEKYYLSDKMIACLTDMTDRNGFVRGKRFNPHTLDSKYAYSITTNTGRRATDNFIILPEKKGYATVVFNGIRVCIRKLTPKECWRLMGFTDEDFEKARKVNSDTQLYKQAGNSIVVKVLERIFEEFI